jgi:predicted RecB family nuclease
MAPTAAKAFVQSKMWMLIALLWLAICKQAFMVCSESGERVAIGRLICGKSASKITVKVDAVRKEVSRTIEKISELLSNPSPPDLILNRHCPYCEFRNSCANKAIEKNDLSLLAGLTEQERARWNRRGIFTVHQLSHTFQPRRRFKRLAGEPEKYHHSVKAIAIREQRIHLVGDPQLLQVPRDGTPIFLDVEAMPHRDFFYLIGIRWDEAGRLVRHSLWADDEGDERSIWCRFLDIVSSVEKPILLHYAM